MTQNTNADYFRSLSPQAREMWRAQYEKNIAIAEGRYRNREGKLRTAGKMPWMLPCWKQGLAMLLEVMEENGEVAVESI